MPRIEERTRRHLLPSAGITLVALIARQGGKSSSRTVASNERLVGTI
jgi:hypothetical protein